MANRIIGIDLGTTYCKVAIPEVRHAGGFQAFDALGCSVILDRLGRPTTPSVVAKDETGQILVGELAKARAGMIPGPVMFAKRSMGDDNSSGIESRGGAQGFRPEEVAEHLLRCLKELAEERLGEKVDGAIIAVPATYSANARRATEEAARRARLGTIQLVPEPVAVAMTYFAGDPRDPLRIMTYDLGGAKFETAIVEKRDGVINILAVDGDNRMGGRDFDAALARWMADQLRAQGYELNPDDPASPAAFARLMVLAERVKIALSDQERVEIRAPATGIVDRSGKPIPIALEISRTELHAMIHFPIDETLTLCRRVIEKLRVSGPESRLDEIVMVGGSSNIPFVKQRLEHEFRKEPRFVQPHLCVALGATVVGRANQATAAAPGSNANTTDNLWIDSSSNDGSEPLIDHDLVRDRGTDLPTAAALAKRPLHFIYLVDCSGSMAGKKIEQLNCAIREAIKTMRDMANEHPNVQVFVRAIKFSNEAQWHIFEPTDVHNLEWTDLKAGGRTAMGHALTEVAKALDLENMPKRGLPPILVLVSDGQPTDDFDSGLRALMDQPWGKRSVRIAIAIDDDADLDALQKFIGHTEWKPLIAANTSDFVRSITWASTVRLKAAANPGSWMMNQADTGHVSTPAPPQEATSFEFESLEIRSGENDVHVNREPPPLRTPLDEIQFTVYRPKTVRPDEWSRMLAFAHLAERRPEAPADQPDPIEQVRAEAAQLLGAAAKKYDDTSKVPARECVPREGEITLVPEMPGVQFDPERLVFRWLDDVHRHDFRLRASAELDGTTARGCLLAYLGPVALGRVELAIKVDSKYAPAAEAAPAEATTGHNFRRRFVSYSHKDKALVRAFEHFVRACGDECLGDWNRLRVGEEWDPAILRLIDEADIFQLFWSTNSMHSGNVRREWEYALSLGRRDFVLPTYWEQPRPQDPPFPYHPPSLPPDALNRLHFQWVPLPQMATAGPPPAAPTARFAGGVFDLRADDDAEGASDSDSQTTVVVGTDSDVGADDVEADGSPMASAVSDSDSQPTGAGLDFDRGTPQYMPPMPTGKRWADEVAPIAPETAAPRKALHRRSAAPPLLSMPLVLLLLGAGLVVMMLLFPPRLWNVERTTRFDELARLMEVQETLLYPAGSDGTPENRLRDLSDDEYYAELAQRSGLSRKQVKEVIEKANSSTDLEAEYQAAMLIRSFDEAEKLAQTQLARNETNAATSGVSTIRSQVNLAQALIGKGEYRAAINVLEKALQQFESLPEGRDAHIALWGDIQGQVGFCHLQLIASVRGNARVANFNLAVRACKFSVTAYNREGSPVAWARAQNNLGVAYRNQATVASGAERQMLLQHAVAAHELALEIFTKGTTPNDWAMTQNSLGIAYRNQATVASGVERKALLYQAVAAHERALEVYTKVDAPNDWAMTQNNLGVAYSYQAELASESECKELLAQAVASYKRALEFLTKDGLPSRRARIQNNLGVAYGYQVSLACEAEPKKLLAQAVAVYDQALEVRTLDALPIDWAETQNNLGAAYSNQAQLASGTERTELLAQAVTSYKAALEVRTKDDAPSDWAATQNNLGLAYWQQAALTTGIDRVRLLDLAIGAYESSLEVYSKRTDARHWSITENNLGVALSDRATLADGAERNTLLAEALATYKKVLGVRTKEDSPNDWAATQNNLGTAYRSQARIADEADRAELLAQAVVAYQRALEVRTNEHAPSDWAATQFNLGVAYREQAELAPRGNRIGLLARAVAAHRHALEVFTTTDSPKEWAMTQIQLSLVYLDEEYRRTLPAEELGQIVEERITALQEVADVTQNGSAVSLAVAFCTEAIDDAERGRELCARWLDRHPDDLEMRANYVEMLLLCARFDECREEYGKLLKEQGDKLSVSNAVSLAAIDALAALLSGKELDARPSLGRAIETWSQQPADFRLAWSWQGIRRFLDRSTDPAVLEHKPACLAVLDAIDGKQRDEAVAALKKIIASGGGPAP